VSPLGVGRGLEYADEIKAAGGSFVASSVAGWLESETEVVIEESFVYLEAHPWIYQSNFS
jgi:hypothetical protein